MVIAHRTAVAAESLTANCNPMVSGLGVPLLAATNNRSSRTSRTLNVHIFRHSYFNLATCAFRRIFHLPLVCSSLHRVRCLGCVWASIAWACHLFKYCILYRNDATSWLVSGPATPRSTAAAFHLPLGHGHRSLWWLDCLDRLHPCGSIFSGPFTPQALWPHAAHLAHPPCFPASSVGSADQAHQMCSVPDLTWSVPGGSLPPGSVRFTVIMGLSHQGSRHLMCDGSAEGWRTSMMLAGD